MSGADSTLAANGTTVATTGAGSAAIVTTGGATALLSGAKITTSGATSDSLVAQNGGRIGDTGPTIASAAGNGATADSGGVLALTGTTLKGATAGVLTSDTLANGATKPVLVDGGSITSVAGPAFAVRGGTADIAVRNGTVVTAGNGTLLDLSNGSHATFTASALNLTGDIVSDASSTGNVFLANGTTLTGEIDPVALTVDNTSTWHMTGSSVLSSLNNAGLVAFAAPTGSPTLAGSYKTLTTGSYVGNGGTIALNTFLGADASPTDRVIVSGGTASGTTGLKIANTAGTGAQTKGDGIPVVVTANGGTTTASAFQLAGPYRRARTNTGSIAVGKATRTAGTCGRNSIRLTPATRSTRPAAVTAATTGMATAARSRIAPGLGLCLTHAAAQCRLRLLHAGQAARARRRRLQPRKAAAGQSRRRGAHRRPELDANAGRFSADERTFFAHSGKDWTLDPAPNGGGSTHAGVTASIGVSNASFSDMARADTANLSTSTGPVEIRAEHRRLLDEVPVRRHVLRQRRPRTTATAIATAMATRRRRTASASHCRRKSAKPFAIGALPVAVEPQAQLMYQYLKLNGFNDNVSAVSGTTTNALRGRVGVRIFRPNLQSDSAAAPPRRTSRPTCCTTSCRRARPSSAARRSRRISAARGTNSASA